MRTDGFKGKSGCFTCNVCGKRTRDVNGENGQSGCCPSCFIRAGHQCSHWDGDHEGRIVDDCPECEKENAVSQLPNAKSNSVATQRNKETFSEVKE